MIDDLFSVLVIGHWQGWRRRRARATSISLALLPLEICNMVEIEWRASAFISIEVAVCVWYLDLCYLPYLPLERQKKALPKEVLVGRHS